jgi:putative DNA primase/helicase
MDVKANGYAVVYGRHKDGNNIYLEPCDAVLAPTPPWANAILRERKTRSGEPVGKGLTEGERHDELVRVTGIYRASGLTTDEVLAALRAVNQARCTPPLDDGELWEIAESTVDWYRPPPTNTRVAPCRECADLRATMSAHAELMRHAGLTPMQKLVGSAVVNEYASAASRGQLNELGFARISYHAIGERIGIVPNPETGRLSSSIGTSVRVLVEVGAARKLTPRSTDPNTGEVRSEVWLRLDHANAADALRSIAHVERERPRRARSQPLGCPDHPKAKVILKTVCGVCGQILPVDTPKKCVDSESSPDWLRSKRHVVGASPSRSAPPMSATEQSGPSPLDLLPPFEPLDDEFVTVDELALNLFPGSRFTAEAP